MKKLLVVLVVGLLIGSAAMADCSLRDFLPDDMGRDPAGAFIFTTVATSSSSTYGSANSSGTSGCNGENDIESSPDIKQNEFVTWNMDDLSEDIAQGGGPHLQSLSGLLGCPDSDYPALAELARRNYARLFPSTEEFEAEVFLARLKEVISNDPRLSESCIHLEEKPPDEDGIQTVMEPAAHDVAGAGPPVLREGKGAKLAIFPEILLGDSPDAAEIESAKLAARISRQIAKHSGSVYVAYSYLDRPKEEHADLRSSVWRIGNSSAQPKVQGMRSRGKALGMDVVMQVLFRSNDRDKGMYFDIIYEVHVLNVNSGHHFKISGKTEVKVGWDLLNEVESSIGEAIEMYKNTALPR